jgi:hypothetical protein
LPPFIDFHHRAASAAKTACWRPRSDPPQQGRGARSADQYYRHRSRTASFQVGFSWLSACRDFLWLNMRGRPRSRGGVGAAQARGGSRPFRSTSSGGPRRNERSVKSRQSSWKLDAV